MLDHAVSYNISDKQGVCLNNWEREEAFVIMNHQIKPEKYLNNALNYRHKGNKMKALHKTQN